jgi:hypothetical protein
MAWNELISGTAGAVALNLLHESMRQVVDDAPRMDLLGERALTKGLDALGMDVPAQPERRALALAGDLISNTAYYALTGLSKPEHAVATGTALGAAAGIGAVLLAGPLGLGSAPARRTPQTALMTVAWYAFGGLVAGLTYKALSERG